MSRPVPDWVGPDRTNSGTGPNDPDNPNAKNYRPPTTNTKYPGLPVNATAAQIVAYNKWWDESGMYWSQFIAANPDQANWIKATAWIYREDTNKIFDKFMLKGITLDDGGGGGGRGGGGGGGGAAANKDQQYAQAAAAIKNRAGTLGIGLDQDAIVSLAKVVVDNNWSDDMLDDYLIPGADNAGMISYGIEEIKKMAADQLLNVSDATAKEWSQKIASGEMTAEAVKSILQTQATAKYGWAASQITQGVSVRDMMLPSRDILARELEMSPDEIDLMDGSWLGMLQQRDDKTNEVRVATDSEIIMRARQDSRWSKTQAAGAAAASAATMIRDYFGG